MRILTTSDLDSVNGGLAPLIPVTWAVVADTGFAGAVGGAWATGWGIGTFVGSNIDSYGSNVNGPKPWWLHRDVQTRNDPFGRYQ